jgi:hypothetical protein
MLCGLTFGESSYGRCERWLMGKTNIISCEHLARTNEPEAKLKKSNIFG